MASHTTATITLLHTADLHLSQSEAAYGLAVLDELAAACNRLRPAAWLLCGDIFDTYADAQQLAGEFRRRLADLSGTPVIMIPGNHEALGAGGGAALEPEDFSPATLEGLEKSCELNLRGLCPQTPSREETRDVDGFQLPEPIMGFNFACSFHQFLI